MVMYVSGTNTMMQNILKCFVILMTKVITEIEVIFLNMSVDIIEISQITEIIGEHYSCFL